MTEDITLEVGEIAPEFEAELSDGSKFVLSEALSSGKGVILYFYPRDNTPGCTSQACDFR
ncbi:MAG: redoxin domain-containing protein, partial [Candidatus Thermoplasmatota archaeon]|nr:redoxin domain-containing protein [Candidatus Thermoplasmatota archaeon]